LIYIKKQALSTSGNSNELLTAYRYLKTTRTFDSKAIHLQRTGRLGTFPASTGQEAIFVGIGLALQDNDIYCPYYRDQGAFITRGVPMETILAYWGGHESSLQHPSYRQDFPICVPIASQCLHAVGAAFAIDHQQRPDGVVCSLGDGATSKGDFYEAINAAGVFDCPVVFVINHNQWAISVPTSKQTNIKELSQKAQAAGIVGISIDGNDVMAVKQTVQQALKTKKPTLIEATCYRHCDHTTADDASRYVDQHQQLSQKNDPLDHIITQLNQSGVSKKMLDTIDHSVDQHVNQAVEQYLKMPPPNPDDLFDHTYQSLPADLIKQKKDCLKEFS
jgi:2-oxoisovalerate dehydrogenase E1 component alpha subunit